VVDHQLSVVAHGGSILRRSRAQWQRDKHPAQGIISIGAAIRALIGEKLFVNFTDYPKKVERHKS
jgi:hypothetical protein